ncbi:hypothetical protein VTJ04DRAFT_4057 [Mycothermus thermophilus]|uniref:uncharacterized protein n=1 Tax=Humicola insolens TaxID=85995 RepID=UPI0037442DF9
MSGAKDKMKGFGIRLFLFLFMMAYSITSTTLFLTGCSSNATANLGLYDVNVTHLVEHLSKWSVTDAALLLPPDLRELFPSYWSFGFCGKMVADINDGQRTASDLNDPQFY